MKSGCKYNVDDETLSLELNQLGLPKGFFFKKKKRIELFINFFEKKQKLYVEHCEAFSKVYSQKKDALQTKLKSETLKCKLGKYFLLKNIYIYIFIFFFKKYLDKQNSDKIRFIETSWLESGLRVGKQC